MPRLVLTRKREQSVSMAAPGGVKIVITVYSADRGQCRFGIQAPECVIVERDNAKRREPRVQIPKNH